MVCFLKHRSLLLTGSKMVGWQLCSNASYPLPAAGFTLPPPGPVEISLRLLKLDRGLHYYLLEAAYSLLAQVHGNTNMVSVFVKGYLLT